MQFVLDETFPSLTSTLLSYQLSAPARACSFDDKNTNLLYCGLTTGQLTIYDVRNTKSYLSILSNVERKVPLISVIPKGNTIVCTDQHSSYLWTLDESQNQYSIQPLYITLSSSSEEEDHEKNVEAIDCQDSLMYSVSLAENTFCTSSINNGAIKHTISHIVSGDNEPLVMSYDWSYKARQEMSFVSRNTHFTRDDNVYLCYADNATVSTMSSIL